MDGGNPKRYTPAGPGRPGVDSGCNTGPGSRKNITVGWTETTTPPQVVRPTSGHLLHSFMPWRHRPPRAPLPTFAPQVVNADGMDDLQVSACERKISWAVRLRTRSIVLRVSSSRTRLRLNYRSSDCLGCFLSRKRLQDARSATGPTPEQHRSHGANERRKTFSH